MNSIITIRTLAGYYQWDPWVNGGAWIETPVGKLDVLYWNIEQVRRVILLLQSLFALNAEYYFGDKVSLEAVSRFPLQPQYFSNRLQQLFAMPMRTQPTLSSLESSEKGGLSSPPR